MLVKFAAALPVLVTVTGEAPLVVPTTWLVTLTFLVDKVMIGDGIVPVPDMLTVCGLPPEASSVTFKVAVRVPAGAGEQVTRLVHLLPAAGPPPHLSRCPRLPA